MVRDLLVSSVIIAGGALAFVNRAAFYDMVGFSPADIAKAREQAQTPETVAVVKEPVTTQLSGSAASIRKADDGQFWTEARVNSTSVKFLVDTGASIVALTPLDAQRAGFRPKDLTYNIPINTANGQIMAAEIELKLISVGSVVVRDVRGVIIPEGLSHSLLGMSFLGELQKVEATKTSLILRQ